MIVTITRCLNEAKNIERFLKGYAFSDVIIVSDGGSTDGSIEMLENSRAKLLHFAESEWVRGQYWNPDNSHFNFIIEAALELNPDFIILDDMDDVPNALLRENARGILEHCTAAQVNAFRLYLWGDEEYFPKMNNYFDPVYKSLWAWNPRKTDIRGDLTKRHGTLIGLSDDVYGIDTPMCLLHKSWRPDTIEAKMDRYNKVGLPMHHPLGFAGKPEPLPEWAHE